MSYKNIAFMKITLIITLALLGIITLFFGLGSTVSSFKQSLGRWSGRIAVTPGMRDFARNMVDFNPKASKYQGFSSEEYCTIQIEDKFYDVVFTPEDGSIAYVRNSAGFIILRNDMISRSLGTEYSWTENQIDNNPFKRIRTEIANKPHLTRVNSFVTISKAIDLFFDYLILLSVCLLIWACFKIFRKKGVNLSKV